MIFRFKDGGGRRQHNEKQNWTHGNRWMGEEWRRFNQQINGEQRRIKTTIGTDCIQHRGWRLRKSREFGGLEQVQLKNR